MKLTKVSIITPLYHKDMSYIKECAEVLKKQILTDYEWIIVTNSSDSKLNVLLNEYVGQVNYKIMIDIEANVATARNKGIEYASGEYLYFLDVDDFIHEHTLYCLVETIEHTKADMVLGSLKKVNKLPSFNTSYSLMLNRLLDERYINAKKITKKTMRATVLNILFSSRFIYENEFKFDESLDDLSDITFTMPAYEKAATILVDKDAKYLKIRRNDAIQDPSLSQRSNRALSYPESLRLAYKKLDPESNVSLILQKRLLYSYHHRYLKAIYGNDESNQSVEIYDVWSKAFNEMSYERFSFSRKLHETEINHLMNGRYDKAKKVARLRSFVKDIKRIIKKPKGAKRYIYSTFMVKKLPIKPNWILYESFLGKNYSDSPKYIFEYLGENYAKDFKHIWVFNETNKELPYDAIQVKRFSFKHLYYMARSRFLVNNMRQPLWYKKREQQTFLETWHGTPLKKLVFDMNEIHSANPNYKLDFYNQSRSWDFLVSANQYSTEIFKRAFLFDNEILEYGYPRNDLLYSPDKDKISLKIKQRLGLPLNKKIVLYAPTWRDDEYYKPGQYKFKLTMDLERLRRELGDEYYFLVRTHYFIADHLDLDNVSDFVYNASKYDDITELYLVSDVLITDYSSVFFDFANLKRPILFFTYDLEKYRDTLRGFYIDLNKDVPGPLIMNNDELINVLKNMEQVNKEYGDRLNKFHDKYCNLDDGHASKRISEKVIINGK